MIRRLVKFVFFLAALGLAGVAVYAWLGDLPPQTGPRSLTVTLDAR